MIVFVLLISRHGKTRLNKYYKDFALKERMSIQKEVTLPSSEGIIIDANVDQQHGDWEVKPTYSFLGVERLQNHFQKVRLPLKAKEA